MRGTKPWNSREMDRSKKIVDESIIHEKDLPENGYGNRSTEKRRYIVDGPYVIDAFELLIEKHCNEKSKDAGRDADPENSEKEIKDYVK